MKVYPFTRVRNWEDETNNTLFIFVGDNVSADVKQLLKSIQQSKNVSSLSTGDHKNLISTFGTEYKDFLGFENLKSSSTSNVVYVHARINPDDNINWIKHKLFYHLYKHTKIASHDDIYIWINKKFPVTPVILQTFIRNAFKNEKRIAFELLVSMVYNFFGMKLATTGLQFVDRIQAISLIEDIKTAKHAEPVIFKYTTEDAFEYVNYNPLRELSDNSNFDSVDKLTVTSYNALLLETFSIDDIFDGCLNIMTLNNFQANVMKSSKAIKKVGKYFPFSQTKRTSDYLATTFKFVEDIENAEKLIQNHNVNEGYRAETNTNFVHLRVNELNFNKRQDLENLFEALNTSQDIPFIKYKAINNNYYKVHKESMVKLKNELLGKWTESKAPQFGKTLDSSYVSLKMHYTKDVYCSLIIFDTMCYDIKFTFGNMMRETTTNIMQYIKNIDDIITIVQGLYSNIYIPHVDKDVFTNTTGSSNTKILRWLTTNNVKSDKHTLNYANFIKVIQQRMFSYFNVIKNPNKNILHLQYKKIDNYLKFENIQVFITNHYVKNKDDMIKKIVSEFVISADDAEKEYDKWTSQNELEVFKMGDKVFVKPKNDNYVNVKIRITSSIDLNFNIEGAKSNIIQQRIINLLVVLMDMSNQKLADKIDIANVKVDSIMFGTTNKWSESPSLPRRNSPSKFTGLQKGDDDIDMELDLGDFGDYDEFGDLFEDDDELRALELEFLKEAQNEEKVKTTSNSKQSNTADDEDDEEEKGTDEESVMKSYFMNMLKSADKELIDYKVPKGQKVLKRYSTVCQWNDRRQPVVVNKAELDKIKTFQKDVKYIKTGSSEELQNKNYYMCPQVWCPKSKIALTYKDFKGKYNESCPYPEIEEKPILLTNHYWGKGETGQNREHFPGFLDPKTHPSRLCLPCCFKKEAKEGSRNKQNENTCKNQWNEELQQEDETEVFGNEKYILAEIFVPLEPFRYGLLPKEVSDMFGNRVCGNGLEGKGLMNDKTDCMLRRGVNQKSQSFLNALISILDNPAITNVQSFVDNFNAHISIQQFISLENGKIMKLFINKEFDIFNSKNFQDFVKWFLAPKQSSYIKMFKLKSIASELATVDLVKGAFIRTQFKKSKSIIREFLIYNGYIHFLQYINENSIEKNYNLLIDYIQTENTWLNINNYNVVVIEHDPTEGKTHMICPFNRNATRTFDLTDPFVFIFKQNNYYEPLCHVRVRQGSIKAETKFVLKTAPSNVRKMIKFYMKNCSIEVPSSTATDIDIFLQTLMGYPVKRYVIDYSFKVCGFLISNINLFVPLKDKVDIYDLNETEFIYYDELPLYKCTYSERDIIDIFNKLYKRTTDKFYNITDVIYDTKDTSRMIGFTLNHSYFVPTNYNETTDSKFVSDLIADDINIFIEHNIDDSRSKRISNDQQIKKYFRQFTSLISDYIANNEELHTELVFLTDNTNPFPKSYKRKKLLHLMSKVLKNEKFVKDLRANVDLNAFTSHFVEDILTTSGNPHSVMLRQMFGVKRKFKKKPYELVFDQKDVIDGRLQEKIKFVQNPYTSLMDRIDKYMREYVFEFTERDEMEYFRQYINTDTLYDDVPYKYKRLLQDFKLLQYNQNTTPYTSSTLYDIMLSVCKAKHITHVTDVQILRAYMKQKTFDKWVKNELDIFNENPSYIQTSKMMKVRTKSFENIFAVLESMNYHPSYFEIMFLAKIAQIRVIVIGRKRGDDEGINVYPDDKHNRYNRYIIFHQYYDRFNYRDVFQLAVKHPNSQSPRVILRKQEVPEMLLKYIK